MEHFYTATNEFYIICRHSMHKRFNSNTGLTTFYIYILYSYNAIYQHNGDVSTEKKLRNVIFQLCFYMLY